MTCLPCLYSYDVNRNSYRLIGPGHKPTDDHDGSWCPSVIMSLAGDDRSKDKTWYLRVVFRDMKLLKSWRMKWKRPWTMKWKVGFYSGA